MDYIGLLEFDAKGKPKIEHRFIGLYTSSAYNRRPWDIPLVRQRLLQCTVPYALEGLVRREIAAVSGASITDVRHGDAVEFAFTLPEPDANAFIARLDDAAQGRAVWPQA